MSLVSRLGELITAIGTDVKSLGTRVSALESKPRVVLTQAAYDALGTKDANTLYVIVG